MRGLIDVADQLWTFSIKLRIGQAQQAFGQSWHRAYCWRPIPNSFCNCGVRPIAPSVRPWPVPKFRVAGAGEEDVPVAAVVGVDEPDVVPV